MSTTYRFHNQVQCDPSTQKMRRSGEESPENPFNIWCDEHNKWWEEIRDKCADCPKNQHPDVVKRRSAQREVDRVLSARHCT